ncbi:hypothetical protein K8R33_04785 [archaeon]|nr:hypothetical protein [archaeon]
MSLIEDAKGEIKRADHLIYVSLKYTRTCDIILNIFKRLIAAYDFAILASLEKAKQENKTSIIPESKLLRVEMLSRLKRKFKKHLDIYNLMKKIENSEFGRREEYRKHVTMVCQVSPDKTLEIDVPTVIDFFEKTKEFVSLTMEYVK